MRFSEKKGLKKIKTDLMKEGLDNDVRIGLWNVFLKIIWNPEVKRYGMKRHMLTFSIIICPRLPEFPHPPDKTQYEPHHSKLHHV